MTPASAATQPDVTPHYKSQSQRYNIKAVLEISDYSARYMLDMAKYGSYTPKWPVDPA